MLLLTWENLKYLSKVNLTLNFTIKKQLLITMIIDYLDNVIFNNLIIQWGINHNTMLVNYYITVGIAKNRD